MRQYAIKKEFELGIEAIGTLRTGYPYAQDVSQVPRLQTPHPAQEGSGIAMCPMAPGPPPCEGGLWCCHVSNGSRPTFWCRRALVLPCVLWHWARLPTGEGSSVAMCPTVPDLPPSTGGLWYRHVSRGTRLTSR
jgi:hypothetical protein